MIRFDASAITVQDLAAVIQEEGYESRNLDRADLLSKAPTQVGLGELVRLGTEPSFYRDGLAVAAAQSKPILVDFSATWCGPCKRFKAETLQDPAIAEALHGFVVLEIDTDENAELAKAYGVSVIPDILLASADGRIVERFTGFEPAEEFLIRLKGMVGKTRPELPATIPRRR